MGKIGGGEWEVQASNYVMNRHRNKRHNIGNIVNGIVIGLHSDKWWLHL